MQASQVKVKVEKKQASPPLARTKTPRSRTWFVCTLLSCSCKMKPFKRDTGFVKHFVEKNARNPTESELQTAREHGITRILAEEAERACTANTSPSSRTRRRSVGAATQSGDASKGKGGASARTPAPEPAGEESEPMVDLSFLLKRGTKVVGDAIPAQMESGSVSLDSLRGKAAVVHKGLLLDGVGLFIKVCTHIPTRPLQCRAFYWHTR